MKFISASFIALYAACVVAQDISADKLPSPPALPHPPSPPSPGSISSFNPYLGHKQLVSPTYRPKVVAAAAAIKKKGNAALAKKALKVAEGMIIILLCISHGTHGLVLEVPTWLWLDTIAAVKNLDGWLKDARATQLATRKPVIFQLEVYNLPDRDCSAKASSGELVVANGGLFSFSLRSIRRLTCCLRRGQVQVAVHRPDRQDSAQVSRCPSFDRS